MEYLAAEIIHGVYSFKGDIWACGVILYALLSGLFPYSNLEDANDRPLPLDTPFKDISAQAKNLLLQMCHKDAKVRLTSQQVLDHPWMTGELRDSGPPIQLGDEVTKRLRGYTAMNRLQKDAMRVIASNMSPDEVHGLQIFFASLDVNGDGSISLDELRAGLDRRGSAMMQDELLAVMHGIDLDNNNSIDYTEFLAATMTRSKAREEKNLLAVFRSLDADGNGMVFFFFSCSLLDTSFSGRLPDG